MEYQPGIPSKARVTHARSRDYRQRKGHARVLARQLFASGFENPAVDVWRENGRGPPPKVEIHKRHLPFLRASNLSSDPTTYTLVCLALLPPSASNESVHLSIHPQLVSPSAVAATLPLVTRILVRLAVRRPPVSLNRASAYCSSRASFCANVNSRI